MGFDPKDCSPRNQNTQTSIFKYAGRKGAEFETRGRFTKGESGRIFLLVNMFYPERMGSGN